MLRYSTALLFLHAPLAAAYDAVDDSNLDAAVKEWFDNPSSGGTTYGAIAGWDVTAVTDWSDFLKESATPALTCPPHPPARPFSPRAVPPRQVDPNRGPGGRGLRRGQLRLPRL